MVVFSFGGGILEYQLHVERIILYFEALLDVLKCELSFVIGDLNFPPESNGSPCAIDWCCMYHFKWPLSKKNCIVGFSMMLQSHR